MRALKKYMSKRPKQDANKTCVERIKPFLLLFKFCGMFANNVTAGRMKRCSWPTYGICVFWISLFVFCFSFLCNFLFALNASLTTMIHLMKHLIRYVSFTADIITAYSSQNSFSKFFDRLNGYDHKAAQLKNKREDNLWIPYIIALSIIFISVMLVIATMNSHMYKDMLVIILNIYTMMLHMINCLEKFLLLYLIFARFKHLNKNIALNVSWNEERREPNAIKVSDVKIMYSMLYDAHEAFNDIYRNPLLLTFTSLMMCIVANMSAFRQETTFNITLLIGPSLMQILIICIICHYTAEEAKNTMLVLNKSMIKLINSEETTTKISILTYFLYNCVSFDAAGFFTINLPLFKSIIATVTTYFIILI